MRIFLVEDREADPNPDSIKVNKCCWFTNRYPTADDPFEVIGIYEVTDIRGVPFYNAVDGAMCELGLSGDVCACRLDDVGMRFPKKR